LYQVGLRGACTGAKGARGKGKAIRLPAWVAFGKKLCGAVAMLAGGGGGAGCCTSREVGSSKCKVLEAVT